MDSSLARLVAIFICLGMAATGVVSVRADDKTDFQGLEEFKAEVLGNEVLALSGVAIVTLKDGNTYLLSLGTTVNQASRDSSIRAKLDTRKVAEAKARKAAAEFIKVEVSTTNRLVELRETKKVSTNEGLKSQMTKLIKVREEIITQKSQVVFAGSKTVATWVSDEGKSFNAVIAFNITNKGTLLR